VKNNLNIDKNFLHHAYCIEGDFSCILPELENFLMNELNFSIHGNQDFWYGEYDTLDIEDSRKLKELHQNKPSTSDKKVFVVNTNFITEKAQNALLKIFEEPSGNTHFFLVIPSTQNILPTLKSRMIIIEHSDENNKNKEAKDFLKSPIGDRLEIIKKIMDSISDEEKSKIEVIKFIESLEVEIKNKKDIKKYAEVLEKIEIIRQYATDPSPSLKMLLEYLAVMIPIL
jgi:DNA polymerase-3 subunit delta'